MDSLKLQAGVLRPYFIQVCPELERYCSSNAASLNYTEVESLCTTTSQSVLDQARMSFPSMSTAIAFYSSLFTVLYTTFTVPYRVVRPSRVVLGLIILACLVANERVTSNNNHPADVIVGCLIGLFFSLFICIGHLNMFANQLSVTNPFSSKRVNWTANGDNDPKEDVTKDEYWNYKPFNIPRVHTLTRPVNLNIKRVDDEDYYPNESPVNVNSLTRPYTTATHNNNNPSNGAYYNPAFTSSENIVSFRSHTPKDEDQDSWAESEYKASVNFKTFNGAAKTTSSRA